jgi:hypothetical protein
MRTLRGRLRSFGTPCLALLLCAAPVNAEAQALVSEASQMVSPGAQLEPVPADEYQKLWFQVLKNARVETGPKLKNLAISSDGLPPSIFRALQEQRTYLEKNSTAVRAALTGARELAGDNASDPSSSQHIPCHKPMIRSVNGKTKGVVFTPMVANNIYKIEGCFFGNVPGVVQLEAHTAVTQAESVHPITMQLDSTSLGAWSDNALKVRLDTGLRGIPDYPVTLVIYPSKHRRIELHGCRFVAARGNPQLLSVIPSAWVSLYPSGVGSRSIRQLGYVSPTEASGAVSTDATASSALVVRSDPEPFGIGRDSYDFSQLNPGWVVEAVQLQTYSISCPEVITSAQSFGRWDAEWTPLGVSIAFQESVCASSRPPRSGFNTSLSHYAIRVWVVGPVGTQPLALVR